MISPFNSLSVARSGMAAYRTWIDATSDNVANINTVRRTSEPAYQARYVDTAEIPASEGGGVRVTGVRFGDPAGRLESDPSSPLADANGMVRAPDVDISEQMTSMIVASRAYQANVASFERARDSYLAALQIGK